MDNIHKIDLNLLVTLEALLTERSVTRAARRLHLSQPSVSVQLRKLRELFGDPLLSVVHGGMAPTTRAAALLPDLRALLNDVRSLLGREPFDPATAQKTWRVAGSDYPEVAILVPLLEHLRRAAPGMSLASTEGSHARMIAQLEAGTLDLAFMALETIPTHLHHSILFRERYVLIVRKRHPILKHRLTARRLAELEYVIMSPEGGGFRGVTDVALEAEGYRRRVTLSTQNFLFIPEVVSQTDLAAMVPSRLVQGRADRLRVIEVPLSLPTFEMAMIWHERFHLDPAHLWLRQQVERCVAV